MALGSTKDLLGMPPAPRTCERVWSSVGTAGQTDPLQSNTDCRGQKKWANGQRPKHYPQEGWVKVGTRRGDSQDSYYPLHKHLYLAFLCGPDLPSDRRLLHAITYKPVHFRSLWGQLGKCCRSIRLTVVWMCKSQHVVAQRDKMDAIMRWRGHMKCYNGFSMLWSVCDAVTVISFMVQESGEPCQNWCSPKNVNLEALCHCELKKTCVPRFISPFEMFLFPFFFMKLDMYAILIDVSCYTCVYIINRHICAGIPHMNTYLYSILIGKVVS